MRVVSKSYRPAFTSRRAVEVTVLIHVHPNDATGRAESHVTSAWKRTGSTLPTRLLARLQASPVRTPVLRTAARLALQAGIGATQTLPQGVGKLPHHLVAQCR
jgi:hypothetical protein